MKTAKRLQTALLATCLLVASIGCQTTVKVLDPNSDPVKVLKGSSIPAPCDGYFVPNSTYLRILDRLSDKDVFGK